MPVASGTDGSENGENKSTHHFWERRWLEVVIRKDRGNENQVAWIQSLAKGELEIPVILRLCPIV